MPDNTVAINTSRTIIRYQGNFGSEVIAKIDNMQNPPLNPSNSNE